jgi:4-carboxymuconolactone decarboxylase
MWWIAAKFMRGQSLGLVLTPLIALSSSVTEAQTMMILRADTLPVRRAPVENFTGEAHVETLFEPNPLSASAGSVTFEPGARTSWHAHPGGQVLIITGGIGRVQQWGRPIEEVRVGDVVTIPAGQKHWHGASPQASMAHIAITEPRDGTSVEWMERVTDEQYHAEGLSTGPKPSKAQQGTAKPSGPVQQRIAPGLATLTDDVLFGDVWRRPELSPRDRSLVTISVLIATGKPAQLAGHLGRALDNGVQPSEASGLLAHLAVYCGWPSVVSALEIYDQVYTARKVDTTALRAVGSRLSAPVSEADRAKALNDELGAIAPKFVELTNNVVFDDLWRRSDLTLRDRSLVTVAALAAMGDDDQLGLYLRRGAESGLTRAQLAEALTHLGFYAGWAKASTALAEVGRILGK